MRSSVEPRRLLSRDRPRSFEGLDDARSSRPHCAFSSQVCFATCWAEIVADTFIQFENPLDGSFTNLNDEILHFELFRIPMTGLHPSIGIAVANVEEHPTNR